MKSLSTKTAVIVSGFIVVLLGIGLYVLHTKGIIHIFESSPSAQSTISANIEPAKKSYITTEPTADPVYNKLTDSLYNFTLEYPSEWTVTDSTRVPIEPKEWTHALDFGPMGNYGISQQLVELYIWDNHENLSLSDWINQFNEMITGENRYTPKTPNAIVAGEESYFYIIPAVQSDAQIYTIFKHEDNIIEFRYSAINNGQNYETFTKILKTLEFGMENTEDYIPTINPDDLMFKN